MPDTTPPTDTQGDETIGWQLIRAERARQIEVEGYTPEHDAVHGPVILRRAGHCYAAAVSADDPWPGGPYGWPWHPRYWKPRGQLRNLVRAGALFMAANEINDAGGVELQRCAESIDHLLAEVDAARPVPAATHTEARYLALRDGLLSIIRSGSGRVVTKVEVDPIRDLIHRVQGPIPTPAATHTDPAARALRDAANVLSLWDEAGPGGGGQPSIVGSIVAWLRDRADGLDAGAAQTPAPTPGQRTVQVVVYTDEPGPEVTEVEALAGTAVLRRRDDGSWGLRWASFVHGYGLLVPVGIRARLRGDA